MARGEILKFQFRPLTLDDKLTRDGLEAVGTLTGVEPYCVVGGIAVQSYLPTSCRRPTSDIDLSVVRAMNYADFRELVRPVEQYLKDHRYNVRERKHSRTYKLEIESSEDPEERLLIEFSRRNGQSFEEARKRLERELQNAKKKILEERSSTYVVASPEDVAVPKLVRTVNSITRRPEMRRHLPREKRPFSDEHIKKRLGFIAHLRDDAVLTPGNVELAEELRLVSDIYDIRILSELTGFNTPYFIEACRDWNTLQRTPERDLVFEATLPEHILNSNK